MSRRLILSNVSPVQEVMKLELLQKENYAFLTKISCLQRTYVTFSTSVNL